MQLCAVITKDDLTSVIEQITPLRATVRPRRVITLGRPTNVELVAGKGLRVSGEARFTWDAYGLPIPVTLRHWQVMLVPSFVSRQGRHLLAFDPVLEGLDFKNVPMFLDERIVEGIKAGLEKHKGKLAWDFEKHLSIARPLPSSLAPSGDWSLGPTSGNVTVTADELRLTLNFALRVTREAPPASLRSASIEASEASEKRAPPSRHVASAR
jgi:hypothetical protein